MFHHLKTAAAGFVLTVVAVVLGVTVAMPKVIGGESLTVLTGSMDPTIPPGSLVLVEPVEPSAVRNGDIVTFQAHPNSPSLVTHRVVAVNFEDEARSFTTKGDANKAEDRRPVPEEALRGKVVFHVPYLGRIANTLRSPLVLGGLVATAGLLHAVSSLRTWLRARRAPSDDVPADPEHLEDVEDVEDAEEKVPETVPVPGPLPTTGDEVAHELLVARVTAHPGGRRELVMLAQAFGGRLVATAREQVVVELVDRPEVIDEFSTQLESWPVRAVWRSGAITVQWEQQRTSDPLPPTPGTSIEPWVPGETDTDLSDEALTQLVWGREAYPEDVRA